MRDATTEMANRTEGCPQLTEMERLTLRVSLIGVRRKIGNGMTTAGIRNQNWSFKIGYKSILLVPSWTSQESPSWDLRNRIKVIRFSSGGNKNLKSIDRSMLMRKINFAMAGPWVLIFFFFFLSLCRDSGAWVLIIFIVYSLWHSQMRRIGNVWINICEYNMSHLWNVWIDIWEYN